MDYSLIIMKFIRKIGKSRREMNSMDLKSNSHSKACKKGIECKNWELRIFLLELNDQMLELNFNLKGN